MKLFAKTEIGLLDLRGTGRLRDVQGLIVTDLSREDCCGFVVETFQKLDLISKQNERHGYSRLYDSLVCYKIAI